MRDHNVERPASAVRVVHWPSQDSMAALRAPVVGDIVICRFLVEKSAGLATIAPVAHLRQPIPFIPFSVLRFAARTADSAPLPVDAPRVVRCRRRADAHRRASPHGDAF
jgi:hypothetical protein